MSDQTPEERLNPEQAAEEIRAFAQSPSLGLEAEVTMQPRVRSDERKSPDEEPRQARFYHEGKDRKEAARGALAELRESLDFPITVDNALDALEVHLEGAVHALRLVRDTRAKMDPTEGE